jgi:hypothetical protein
MKFRTEISLPSYPFHISFEESILSAGSCFAVNIAEELKKRFFNVMFNPFGTLYNTASVLNMFELAKSKSQLQKEDLIFHNGEWHSFYHNSEFSHFHPEIALEKINFSIIKLNEFLQKNDVVILTYGTSYVYIHKARNLIVSNCHKIPQEDFSRKLLSTEENFYYMQKTIEIIKSFNPKVKIIISVSPVRHLKDGLHANQISKAHLLLAVEKATKEIENCFYFPSYEIVLDDLRDYRFFSSDLAHPNEFAIAYIWEKFAQAFFESKTLEYIKEAEKVRSALEHRPINLDSPSYKNFLNGLARQIEKIKIKYPAVNFDEAERILREKLNALK